VVVCAHVIVKFLERLPCALALQPCCILVLEVNGAATNNASFTNTEHPHVLIL